MQLLIVEDNQTDRELLRYLLEARFPPETTQFLEASRLSEALDMLSWEGIDAVILDLNLPDSAGKATFLKIQEQCPDVAIIVMTHNKDRNLAVDLIKDGAADYVLKNYTDEEELFRRVMFAIEKHQRTVRVQPENAAYIHELEKAKAGLKTAKLSGSPSAIRDMTVATTSAMADLTHQTFAEIQKLSAQQKYMLDTVENLDKELLKGHSGRPSMRSQVDLLDHRVGAVETRLQQQNEAEATGRQTALQLQQTKITNRTKILVAILALLGAILSAVVTYEIAIQKGPEPTKEPK